MSSCGRNWQSRPMTSPSPSYRGYRFPPEIISHAVWQGVWDFVGRRRHHDAAVRCLLGPFQVTVAGTYLNVAIAEG